MTALTMPARPDEDDARLRPVPWRRMAGVTWRQHRIALAGVAVLLGALAVWLWIIGTPLHHAYAAARRLPPGKLARLRRPGRHFPGHGQPSDGADHPGGVFLQVVPVLIGAFAGAPVLARELETGTFRYAWTQGFGRWRWALAKLVLLAVVLAAAGVAFGVLLSWYYQPYFASGNQALGLPEHPVRPAVQPARGRVPRLDLVAFAIGALAGMLIRRVVPAIVATLAVYAGLAFATARAAARALPDAAGSPPTTSACPSTAWIISQWSAKDGRFAFAGFPRSTSSTGSALPFQRGRERRAFRWKHCAPCLIPARLHAVDQLSAGQPVLALPVDRGRLAARAVRAAHRRNRLAGPPPRRLTPPAMRPLRVLPSSGEGILRQMKARWSARPALNRRAASIRQK